MTDTTVTDFLQTFTVEVTPKQVEKFDDLGEILPRGTRVYLAHIDGTPFEDMIATARRLRAEGMDPMPHLPARIIPSRDVLEEWVARYAGEAGVTSVLTIAGGVDTPRGPFSDSMQVLETGVFQRAGIETIAVAGHPEGNKDIGEAGISRALAWKNEFAARHGLSMNITTQFCFEAQPVIAWAERLRAEGNTLPIDIGVAGPAKLSTLIKYATMCGVGNSMRVLTRQARNVTKLMTVAGPDAFVSQLADYKARNPDGPIRQLHFFPLGGIRQTADWIRERRGGLHAQVPLKAPAAREVA